jgi:thioredoxin-related protein
MEPIVNGLEQAYTPEFTIARVDVSGSKGKALARQYGCIGTPAFVIFDKSGEQVRRLQGAHASSTFEQEIDRILAE